jgi:hypothetical protein
MASRRTKSIGTKVTPEEYARIQTLAGEQPVSEWVRAALLKAADPLAGDATPPHSLPMSDSVGYSCVWTVLVVRAFVL